MDLAPLHPCNNFTTANELTGPLTHGTNVADSAGTNVADAAILTLISSLFQGLSPSCGGNKHTFLPISFCWVLEKFYARILLASSS